MSFPMKKCKCGVRASYVLHGFAYCAECDPILCNFKAEVAKAKQAIKDFKADIGSYCLKANATRIERKLAGYRERHKELLEYLKRTKERVKSRQAERIR